MAPAPDQATYTGRGGSGAGELSRSLSIPASYASVIAISPTDSMGSLSSLEKLMEASGSAATIVQGQSSAPGASTSVSFTSRSATTTPTSSAYWGQDVVTMLAGGAQPANANELLGSPHLSDWQTLLDGKCAQQPPYKFLTPVSMAPTSTRNIVENARIRDMLVGRMGKAGAGGKGWSSMEVAGAGITVDPTKGGLALQGMGLATSHCLEQFTSDPAFAERAAKFSSFGSGGKHPQIALPLPVGDGGCKPRSRSAERNGSGRLSRTSSSQNSSGAVRKVAVVEEKQQQQPAASAAVAQAVASAGAAAAERSSCDMDVDGVINSDDKSPPGSAPTQPELEAIEGATNLATMEHGAHEVEVAAATREPTNSCSAEQQQQLEPRASSGDPGSSPATSPARSPSGGSDDSDRRKRKNSPAPADKSRTDPKVSVHLPFHLPRLF